MQRHRRAHATCFSGEVRREGLGGCREVGDMRIHKEVARAAPDEAIAAQKPLPGKVATFKDSSGARIGLKNRRLNSDYIGASMSPRTSSRQVASCYAFAPHFRRKVVGNFRGSVLRGRLYETLQFQLSG